MKTRILSLCLLFLVLGTATAWADKYYKARYSYSSKHRVSELKTDGTKYMIYNTTFNNNTAQKKVEDFTGFLYQNNTGMGLWKSKDSGIYIYNQCFVFTLENAGDDDPATYYVKSENGVYVDVEGNPSVDPVKLYFYNWDDATHYQTIINEKDTIVSEYSVDGNGAVNLNEKNGIEQAFVRSEHEDYTVIPEHQITFKDNKVFVICNEDTTKYWSGNQNSFFQWETGQPFAFYETDEVTSMSSFDIKDLHIFSRCDIYSAQKIYGYVQDAGKYSTNHQSTTEGSLAALLDDDYTSYFHSAYEADYDDVHYLQADLGTTTDAFHIFYKKRMQNNDNRPTSIVVYGTNTPDNEASWVQIKELTGLPTDAGDVEYFSDVIESGTAYQHLRFAVTATNNSTEYFTFSEFYVLPNEDAIVNARAYLDASLPLVATEADFKAKIDEYNMNASAVKLLSGVPIPGNKYRFYADTYSGDAYVSRDVSIAVADDVYSLVATNYHTAAAADKALFEWYCEETSNGKLVFRNVKYNDKYLANGTVSDTPYEWVFNTNYTQHHGVPLSDNNGKYLTLLNDGTKWVEEIGWIQNQKSTANCTDFVFLPVDVTGNEKRITIIATELATRNARLTLSNDNTKEYEIPFSRIFSSATDLPVLVSMAGEYHTFAGFFKKGTENTPENNLGTVINETVYNNIVSGDTLEARFTVKSPFVKSTDGNIKLYRIKSRRPKQVATQQARPNRANINIEEGGQVGSSDGVSLYAKFATKDSNLELVYADDLASANTLFYFTNVDSCKDEAVNVFINSAITTRKFKEANEWTDAGKLYFVQPNLVNGGYTGYTISGTKLDATNNPGGAWYGDHNTNTVTFGKAEDEGAAWDFEPVGDDEAKKLLKEYINSLATGIMDDLLAKKDSSEFYDADRVQSAIDFIETYVGTYTPGANPGEGTFTGGTLDDITISALVEKSQDFHMLEHELAYALQRLPDYTKTDDDVDTDKEIEAEDIFEPAWYYVKNVYGTAEAETKGEPMYARHNGANNHMKLHKGATSLANLFYFAGTKKRNDNEEYNDDFLDVHVHNFMAQNLASKTNADDSTLVSDNNTIFDIAKFEGIGEENQEIANVQKLSKDIAWEITAEFDNATGTFSNGWGTSLLATGEKSNSGAYPSGFQVFLKVDGSLVIKAGDSGNYDKYRFTHTQNAYSHLKVVLSYAEKRLKVYITNSQGLTQSVKDIRNDGLDYIPCEQMADITQMCAFMPKGVFIEKLAADAVSAMKWNKHSNNADGFAQWFIHPSSNTTYLGHSITVEGPDDLNMGWANADGEHDEVFVDMGTSNYATWQFEKVTDFDAHIKEFIELCDIKQCVIYNKEYVALYNLIMAKKADIEAQPNGANEEIDFNAAVKAFRDYRADNGPDPKTLKAPASDKLYTIHHVPASMPNDFKVSDRNVVMINEDVNVGDDFDSRGVWCFEGTEGTDGLIALDENLKLKSLHTQSWVNGTGFTDASLTLCDESNAAVTIDKVGVANVRLKVNNNYLSTNGDNIVAKADTVASNYVGTTFSHENGANIQASSAKYDNLAVPTAFGFAGEMNGNPITTFKTGGSITSSILCPAQRASDTEAPEFTFTLTYSSLPANATYNNVALDIHAFNGSGEYQEHSDNPVRQWNVVVKNDSDTELGKLADIDIAKGVNPSGDRHKVWDVVLETPAQADADGNLTVKIIVSKGTTNNGCFFGLSSVALSTAGEGHDQWYIEEVENPEEKVYYNVPSLSSATKPDGRAYASLYLGFNAKVPTGVDAWIVNDINEIDQLQMVDMKGIVPANEGVILTSASPMSNQKFYYSAAAPTVDTSENKLLGTAYTTLVECGNIYNIYMLGKKNDRIAMYWAYENRDDSGNKVTDANGSTNNNEGGYVQCNANKSYLMIEEENSQSAPAMLSFNFDGSTTDIDDINDADAVVNENNSGVYDLQGRKLERVTEPGIYIVNGKKVFVREIE